MGKFEEPEIKKFQNLPLDQRKRRSEVTAQQCGRERTFLQKALLFFQTSRPGGYAVHSKAYKYLLLMHVSFFHCVHIKQSTFFLIINILENGIGEKKSQVVF